MPYELALRGRWEERGIQQDWQCYFIEGRNQDDPEHRDKIRPEQYLEEFRIASAGAA